MINDKVREQLSALLDGQLLPEEKSLLEEKIKTDPEVRAEWDSMHEFAGFIAATAPAPVSAPVDFRAKIMEQIKATPLDGSGSSDHTGSASKGTPGKSTFSKFNAPTYLISGAVLVGLVGTMVYLDRAHQNGSVAVPISADALGSSPSAAPSFSNPAPGVDAAAIQGQGKQSAGDTQSQLKGEVLTLGEGRAEQTGGVVAQPWKNGRTANTGNVVLDVTTRSLNLESQSGWNQEKVVALCKQEKVRISASVILDLSRRHHLNPGLLCSAVQSVSDRPVEELARELRTSLNASTAFSGEDRLKKCLRDLKVRESYYEQWRERL